MRCRSRLRFLQALGVKHVCEDLSTAHCHVVRVCPLIPIVASRSREVGLPDSAREPERFCNLAGLCARVRAQARQSQRSYGPSVLRFYCVSKCMHCRCHFLIPRLVGEARGRWKCESKRVSRSPHENSLVHPEVCEATAISR